MKYLAKNVQVIQFIWIFTQHKVKRGGSCPYVSMVAMLLTCRDEGIKTHQTRQEQHFIPSLYIVPFFQSCIVENVTQYDSGMIFLCKQLIKNWTTIFL